MFKEINFIRKSINFILFFIVLISVLNLAVFSEIKAKASNDEIYTGTINSISNQNCLDNPKTFCQVAKVLVNQGGNQQAVENVQIKSLNKDIQDVGANYRVGDKIQIKKVNLDGKTSYLQAIAIDSGDLIIYLVGSLCVLVILVARWKGFQALLSLAATTWLLFGYLLPFFQKNPSQILNVGIPACFMFLFLNLILGHGWNRVSWIALAGSSISFVISVLISLLTVNIFRLNGLGSDGAIFLASAGFTVSQLADLFLIGTLLAVTGALDDVTAAQAASIQEIAIAKNGASWIELFKQGMRVGQEHLVSMINTLILAFVGAALPSFMVLYLQNQTNIWFLLSREDVLEEIVRAVLASFSLVLAIPLTTLLASLIFARIFSVSSKQESKKAI